MSSKLMKYEFMTKYTAQNEWIEGKGLLIWLAFFFSEIGAGIYVVALFLNFQPGWLFGWLLTLVLGGLIHLAYLGSPMRVWRVFFRPKSSEISRGMWAVLLFAVFGFFQVLPVVIPGLPWVGDSLILKVIMGVLCFLIITHGFLTMSVVKALPLWNSSMMTPLSLVSGICVGSQTVILMLSMTGTELNTAELWARWSLLGYMGVLVMFLFGTAHASDAARVSIRELLRGDSSIRFWGGVVVIGIVIPLILTLVVWGGSLEKLSGGILYPRFICIVIGDLVMRYGIMKCALYSPVV
jgi:formate-dependent nitrite reductase membrane component NrfD